MNETTLQMAAETFARLLRDWLSPDEMAEVVRINALPGSNPLVCASHDFCDATMAMHEALCEVLGREPEVTGDDPLDLDLWNSAWDLAKAARFDLELLDAIRGPNHDCKGPLLPEQVACLADPAREDEALDMIHDLEARVGYSADSCDAMREFLQDR